MSRPEEYRQPLEIERLVPADKRRVSVDDHAHFIRCMSVNDQGRDEIDELVSEIRAAEPQREGKRR